MPVAQATAQHGGAGQSRERHGARERSLRSREGRPCHDGATTPGGHACADTYPTIADHGLIGDLQTAALVATDGTIDWFCVPRFDSPSIFASLLDAERGGHFRIAPDGRRLRDAAAVPARHRRS